MAENRPNIALLLALRKDNIALLFLNKFKVKKSYFLNFSGLSVSDSMKEIKSAISFLVRSSGASDKVWFGIS